MLNLNDLPDDILIYEIYQRVHKLYMIDLIYELYEECLEYEWRKENGDEDEDWETESSQSDESYSCESE